MTTSAIDAASIVIRDDDTAIDRDHDLGLEIMVYDDSDMRLQSPSGIGVGLTTSWILGGRLYRLFKRIDAQHGFRSHDEMWDWLLRQSRQNTRISKIEFWGHGSPGKIYLDGTGEDLSLRIGVMEKMDLAPDTLVWFRSCATFAGEAGHELALRASKALGCRVSGFTRNIGLFHSGSQTLEPGRMPTWPYDLDDDNRPQKSGMFVPRTLTFLGDTPTK